MIEYIDPLKLIKCQRFDLVAKYIYAINYQKNSTNSGGWFLEIYMRHIEVFNGFVEADESNKYGADAFINSFNHLLNDIGKNGFNSEPTRMPEGTTDHAMAVTYFVFNNRLMCGPPSSVSMT